MFQINVLNKHQKNKLKYNKKVKIFTIISQFMIAGFFGFILETLFCIPFTDSIVDRGFLIGPFIPLYGFMVILIIIMFPRPKCTIKYFILYFITIGIVATLLEFIVGNFIEYFFDTVLWEYSNKMPLTYKYISFPISVCWGLIGASYLIYIIPLVNELSNKINKDYKIIIAIFFLSILIIDFILSICLFYESGQYNELYEYQLKSIIFYCKTP